MIGTFFSKIYQNIFGTEYHIIVSYLLLYILYIKKNEIVYNSPRISCFRNENAWHSGGNMFSPNSQLYYPFIGPITDNQVKNSSS